MTYYVYVLMSTTKKYRYVGISSEPDIRVQRHNLGQNKKTKAYAPFRQIVIEKHASRDEARQREKYLKSGIGREFLDQLQTDSKDYFGYMPGWRNW